MLKMEEISTDQIIKFILFLILAGIVIFGIRYLFIKFGWMP